MPKEDIVIRGNFGIYAVQGILHGTLGGAIASEELIP